MRTVAALALAAALLGCGSSSTGRAAPEATQGDEAAAPRPAPAPLPPGRGAAELLASLEPARIDPADEEGIRELAAASAPKVTFLSLIPLMAANVPADAGEDHCPSVTRDGETTTYRGGCTDDEGTAWHGVAVVRGAATPEGMQGVVYEGFGFDKIIECDDGPRESRWQANGRVDPEADGSVTRFAIDLAFEGHGVDEQCRPLRGTGAIRYQGTQARARDAVRWNGSGRYGWEGFGVVEVRTEDELLNQRNCRHEALMGSTTVRGADHTVTFLYDGDTDCDEESTAHWTLDGEPRGELSGVGCAAGGGAASLPWPLVLGLAVLSRRVLSRSSR